MASLLVTVIRLRPQFPRLKLESHHGLTNISDLKPMGRIHLHYEALYHREQRARTKFHRSLVNPTSTCLQRSRCTVTGYIHLRQLLFHRAPHFLL